MTAWADRPASLRNRAASLAPVGRVNAYNHSLGLPVIYVIYNLYDNSYIIYIIIQVIGKK